MEVRVVRRRRAASSIPDYKLRGRDALASQPVRRGAGSCRVGSSIPCPLAPCRSPTLPFLRVLYTERQCGRDHGVPPAAWRVGAGGVPVPAAAAASVERGGHCVETPTVAARQSPFHRTRRFGGRWWPRVKVGGGDRCWGLARSAAWGRQRDSPGFRRSKRGGISCRRTVSAKSAPHSGRREGDAASFRGAPVFRVHLAQNRRVCAHFAAAGTA